MKMLQGSSYYVFSREVTGLHADLQLSRANLSRATKGGDRSTPIWASRLLRVLTCLVTSCTQIYGPTAGKYRQSRTAKPFWALRMTVDSRAVQSTVRI